MMTRGYYAHASLSLGGIIHKDWFLRFSGEMYDEFVLWQTGETQ
jgi:hypothetical protein